MSESGAERTTVQTYVPANQKATWTDDAEAMDMSLSEFVRTMVQAGRRGFPDTLDDESVGSDARPKTVDEEQREEPRSPPVDPRGRDLETVLLDELRDAPREYDALVEACLSDVRESVADEVDAIVRELQAENRVAHSPREGRYTLLDDE